MEQISNEAALAAQKASEILTLSEKQLDSHRQWICAQLALVASARQAIISAVDLPVLDGITGLRQGGYRGGSPGAMQM